MKRVLSVFLTAVTLFSVLALAGCTEKTEQQTKGESDVESGIEQSGVSDGIISGRSNDAYYEDGNIIVPIHLEKRYMQYTVKNEKYTWYIRCSIGVDYQYSCEMTTLKLECKDNIVTIPEEYANENTFIKTRCRNVACVILVTQKENQ